MVSDEELVARCRGRDQDAFAELVRRHQARMYAICRRVTCNDQDALDALQTALLVVWERIGQFQGRSQIGTWLYRVATNAALDEVRRRDRRPTPVEELHRPGASPDTPDQTVVAQRMMDWAMAQLPPQYRAAVTLHAEGFRYREIATVLGLPSGTVATQILRGRQALAEVLSLYA